MSIGVAALALAAGLGLPARAAGADGPYYIHAAEVNLRESPNGEIILVFEINDKVFVVERQGNWSYVSAPGREAKGWCWSEYIGEGRLPVPEQNGSADGDENAIEVVKPPAAPAQPAVAPDSGVQESAPASVENTTVEDESIQPASPVAVLTGNQRAGTSLDEVMEANGSVPPPATEGEATDTEDPLSVFSFGRAAGGLAGAWSERGRQDTSGAGEDFIPDEGAAGGAADVPEPVPAPDWRPPAQQPTPEESKAEFYQPFTAEPAAVTTPLMLESAFYRPVGGNDIALVSGANVNVRKEASLKSAVITRVNTGDKVYIVGYDDPWYYVSIPAQDLKGYVYGQYIDELPRVEITGTSVRLREGPGLGARIKTELDRGEVFYEFKRQGGWVLLASSASGLKGWVHGDYVGRTERSASRPYSVSGEGVNFRASPNVDADILAQLDRGTEVAVLGRNEKWSFIEYASQQGWMYSQYLTPLGRGTVVAVSPIAERLIARAKAMQGTPYVWGGSGDGGVDCSGLIYKLLLEEGAEQNGLPRRASEQMAELGVAVGKEDLQPGDLVFFSTYKPGPSHVGIYLGDGDFIHASSAQGKVCISNMSEGYYKRRFVGARRITEEELRRLR